MDYHLCHCVKNQGSMIGMANLEANGEALSRSGNPGAAAAPCGWNARILSQTPTQTLVRI